MESDSRNPLEQYRAAIPYPPLRVAEKNLKYAQILHNDFAGQCGEATAVMQYEFQSFALVDQEKLATALHYIGIVEMTHLEMLGKLITLLGGVPRYTGFSRGRPYYWTAQTVDYTLKPRELLINNLYGERVAIANYRQSMAWINDDNINAVLRRIILDEEHHIELFTSLLAEYLPNE